MTTPDIPTRRYPGAAITLCRSCMVAAGYWSPDDPLCPTCAAIAREAGE